MERVERRDLSECEEDGTFGGSAEGMACAAASCSSASLLLRLRDGVRLLNLFMFVDSEAVGNESQTEDDLDVGQAHAQADWCL